MTQFVNLLVELEPLQEADSEAKQIQPDSQASELNKQLRKDIVYYWLTDPTYSDLHAAHADYPTTEIICLIQLQ